VLFVVTVHANGRSRIGTTTELGASIRQWRRRYGVFIPVVATAVDFTARAEWVTTTEAARRYRLAPVDQAAQLAVLNQIRTIGPAADQLLTEWRLAVVAAHEWRRTGFAVKEVGVVSE
jgi:hypothetical protein